MRTIKCDLKVLILLISQGFNANTEPLTEFLYHALVPKACAT